jgi:pyruvate dehydrogenase E1 component alpha subunit
LQVDGNDILATRQVIGDAIEKARRGEGPTLIEAITYRLCDHTTADDASRYQPAVEVSAAKPREPISRFRHFLEEQKLWTASDEEALVIESAKAVERAVEEYVNKEPQPVSSIFDYHYAELPDYLVEQRAIAMEEADRA